MKRIAEYKRASPWAGKVARRSLQEVVRGFDADPDIWGISIIIDPLWGGNVDDLIEARRLTKKPILVKSGPRLPLDVGLATDLGASFVLTYDPDVARDHPGQAWLEIHDPIELLVLPESLPLVIVANNRDVKTGKLDPGAADEICRHVDHSLVCAASGYDSWEEIPDEFDFGIIGTALA